MKKIILCFSTMCFLMAACNDDNTDPLGGGYIELSSGESTVRISDDKTGASVSLGEEGGTVTILIATDIEGLTVENDNKDWCVGTLSGTNLTIAVAESPLAEDRQSVVRIVAGSSTKSTIEINQSGTDRATIEITYDGAIISMNGGTAHITATSNKNVIEADYSEGWLTVTQSSNEFTVLAEANGTGKRRSATLTLTAGVTGNSEMAELTVTQSGGEMILEYTTFQPNTVVPLPFWVGEYGDFIIDVTVDWGDGTLPDTFLSSTPTHTYDEAGTYVITISGTAGCIRTNFEEFFAVRDINQDPVAGNYPQRYISDVLAWGNMGAKNMQYALYRCSNVKSLPPDIDGAFSEVTTFYEAFYFPQDEGEEPCKLAELPQGLFTYASKVTTFYGAFISNPHISEIPDGFFSNCISATNFFRVFWQCTNLERIGEGVFANCRAVENFGQAFYNCIALKDIPNDIFEDCRAVTDFRNTFRIVDSEIVTLDCESPFTVIEGKKIHLYERNDYPQYFTTVTYPSYCFTGRVNLSDYADIVAAGWN